MTFTEGLFDVKLTANGTILLLMISLYTNARENQAK